MSIKRKNTRFIEITTGFLLIFSVLSVLVAILVNFDYTIPDATFEEDISFLMDNISSQKVSAIAWLSTGIINLLFMPLYLILFTRYQKGMHILNSFLILAMAWSFFTIGINELYIANTSLRSLLDPEQIASISTNILLPKIGRIILLQKIGISAFGAFATVFTISRFSEVKFPVIGSTLAFLAGPVIIAFTWLNSDHIILTSALAVAWTGLLMIGASIVNKGLELKHLEQ